MATRPLLPTHLWLLAALYFIASLAHFTLAAVLQTRRDKDAVDR